MASATAHPNHHLISSEDVEGTDVYDLKGNKVGEIDHRLIRRQDERERAGPLHGRGIGPLHHRHDLVPRVPPHPFDRGADPDRAFAHGSRGQPRSNMRRRS